jgi:hypothetical protein
LDHNPEFAWYSTYSCTSVIANLVTTIGEYSSGSLQTSYTISAVSSGDDGGLNAFSVQVRFQSTDFQPTSTPPITPPPKTLPATVTVTTTSAAGASGGLSGGARAGVGVGVVIIVLALALLGALLYLHRQRQRVLMQPAEPRVDAYDTAARPELESGGILRESPAAYPYHQPDAMKPVSPPAMPDAASQLYMESQYAPAAAEMSAVPYAPAAMEMSAALHQEASELSGSVPEDGQARSIGEGDADESEEEVRRRLNRAKEERESLARIVELRRLESVLERQLANRRQSGNGGDPSAAV